MKLIITSVDALFDLETYDYFPDIKEALEHFKGLADDYEVVIVSVDKDKLARVPDDGFHTLHLGNKYMRKSPDFIQWVVGKLNIDYNDIFILGAKDDDFIVAANAKVVLLTAVYAQKNNPDQRIYTEGRGIAIHTPQRLINFFDHFLTLDRPWFYSLEVDEQTTLYGLTDAMTNRQEDGNVRNICEKFKHYLKDGDDTYRNSFLIYALMSVYRIFKEVQDINYWAYYPSSSTNDNETLKSFKEILRKSFKSNMTDDDLLIRVKDSPQRKKMSEAKRVEDGCDSQFDSITLNPWFQGKIEGKNVCVIDDFTNHGSSCETVRHLLEYAGVAKVIFISLGKFRYDYKKYDYTIKGDVYTKYGYTRNGGYTLLKGKVNYDSSQELLESLKDVIK